MNLSDLRDELVRQSGRYDLVNEDGTDNGANFYINAGQQFLDRLIEKHTDLGRVFRLIEAGTHLVEFANCRAIHEVGLGDSESFNWLERMTLQNLRAAYNKPFELMESGRPGVFAPAYLRGMNVDGPDYGGISGYMNVSDSWKEHNGIVLCPPTDREYHLEIWGKFYTSSLVNNTDKSFWSVNYDYILVMASQRAIEVFHRNTQGVNDWTNAIQSELMGIEKDFVEQSYFDIDQLEG